MERRVANRWRVRSQQLYFGIWQLRISTSNPSAPLFQTVGAIEGRVAERSENIYVHTNTRRKDELPFFPYPCLDVRVQNYHRAPLLSRRSSAHTPRQTGDGLRIQQLGIAWNVSTHVWRLVENSYLLLSFSFFFVFQVYFVTRNTKIANVLPAKFLSSTECHSECSVSNIAYTFASYNAFRCKLLEGLISRKRRQSNNFE